MLEFVLEFLRPDAVLVFLEKQLEGWKMTAELFNISSWP